MRKPIILLPFILVYKIVFGIFKFIISICRYFYKGIETIIKIIFIVIFGVCKYFVNGVKTVILIIFMPFKLFKKPKKDKVKTLKEKNNVIDSNTIDIKRFNNLRKIKEKEIKKLKEQSSKKAHTERRKKEKEVYINENVKSPDLLANNVGNFLNKLSNIPKAIKQKISNNEFVKHSRNRDMMKREALLIDFDGKDAEKSEKKVLYEYIAKNKEGKLVKDYFEAYSKVEVHSFLLSEGFEVYSIKTSPWIQFIGKRQNVNNTKFKNKDLIFFLTQLSTYIKAGIPLVESLKILERQYKNKKYKRILTAIIYDLTMGENFSEALLKQNVASIITI